MKKGKPLTSSQKRNRTFVVRLTVLILLTVGVYLLLREATWIDSRSDRYFGNFDYRESSWVYKKGDTLLEEELTLPAFRQMEKGEVYSISTVLTYPSYKDFDPTCFFFVDHMYTRVLLDGKEIYSYMPGDVEKLDHSKSPGNVYVATQLTANSSGKVLTIEFVPSLDMNIEYQLPNPYFGDYSTQMREIFWRDLPHNIISAITLFLGLVCIFYSTFTMFRSSYREGMFIGTFAILFALYNLTESDFDFYMISNPYYTYALDYITFTLIPIFFLAFLRERMGKIQKRISLGLILGDVGMFVTEIVLHVTGVFDMREFLTILHVVYSVELVVHFVLLITSERVRRKIPLLAQIIPIGIGMVVDAMVYYMHWQLGSSDSTFTAMGVMIFLLFEAVYAWKYSIEIYTESTRSRAYQQMAYVDSLTGVGNRRAFDIEKETLESGQKVYETLTVLSADLNNLKVTNDKWGHASGDFIIRGAANVLGDLVEEKGELFRIGGDEFVAFLYDMPRPELEKRLKEMYTQIDKVNSNSTAKVDLAVGIQVSRGNIDSAIAAADRNMYADKARRKAQLEQ